MPDIAQACGKRGNVKAYAKQFYTSKTWKRCRKEYLQSVSFLCERCYAKGILTPAKIVHHKTWITPDNIGDPRITISHDNLEALCWKCHDEEHDHGYDHRTQRGDKSRFRVDESGNVTIKEDNVNNFDKTVNNFKRNVNNSTKNVNNSPHCG